MASETKMPVEIAEIPDEMPMERELRLREEEAKRSQHEEQQPDSEPSDELL